MKITPHHFFSLFGGFLFLFEAKCTNTASRTQQIVRYIATPNQFRGQGYRLFLLIKRLYFAQHFILFCALSIILFVNS